MWKKLSIGEEILLLFIITMIVSIFIAYTIQKKHKEAHDVMNKQYLVLKVSQTDLRERFTDMEIQQFTDKDMEVLAYFISLSYPKPEFLDNMERVGSKILAEKFKQER